MALVPNIVLGYAKLAGKYKKSWGEKLMNAAKIIGGFDGSKLSVIIDDNDFQVKFRKASETDSHSHDELYKDGCIFYKGYANPVKIKPSEDAKEYDLIASKKYQMAMRMNVLEQAFDTQSEGLDLMHKLMIGNIVAIFVLILVVASV